MWVRGCHKTKRRKIVSGTFSQRAIAVHEHFITELTEQVLDKVLGRCLVASRSISRRSASTQLADLSKSTA